MAESKKRSRTDYTIAWICALPLELTAATAMLDDVHPPLPQLSPASFTYALGKISGHNIVLACLPAGWYGTTAAAAVASHLRSAFPAIQYGVLVGIGGGVPSPRVDIRLGDVVVSKPMAKSSGVVQYDFGKATRDGLQHIGTVNQPPLILLTAVSQLQAGQLREGNCRLSNIMDHVLLRNPPMVAGFSGPLAEDCLFQAAYDHPEDENTCESCDRNQEVIRSVRSTKEPQAHYGNIASGNQVIKDGRTRDRIAQEHDCLCFEMEAAGIMNELPCLVIRGICDYCDSHKNKDWQGYAALTAAAYAKVLLGVIPANQPRHREATRKVGWEVPFERNPRFLGRSQQVTHLEDVILGNTAVRKVALSGLGGVGKTQIALEVAYRIRERDPERSIFWIPSTNTEAIEQAFLSISDSIGLQGVPLPDVKKEVKEHLSSGRAGPWLLIIDNADDMAMWTASAGLSPPLKAFLPQGEYGFILFTSRNQQLATRLVGPEVIQVQEMDAMTTMDLLGASLIRKELVDDKDSVAELLNRVCGLPLAIIQAAAYVNENLISLPQYISLLNQQEKELVELLSEDFEDDWRYGDLQNAIAVTWLVSFDQIQRLNSLAADYLSFMSCMDPRDIPESLLPQSDNTSPVQHTKALGILKSYSFITEQTNSQFSIHRLVHLATRNWLRNSGKLTDWTIQATQRLHDIFPSIDPQNRSRWREYLPHAQFLLQNTNSTGNINCCPKLCAVVWRCLFEDGRYDEAEGLLQEVFEAQCAVLGIDHPDTLRSMDYLGMLLVSQSKYEEAEAMHRQALDGFQQILGVDHSKTLAVMGNLGLALAGQGKYEEAEAVTQYVLIGYQRMLGTDHPDILLSMSNLAVVLGHHGKYEEAEAMHRQALAIRKKVLGADHIAAVASMGYLGEVLAKQGKYEEAEVILQQLLRGRQKI